MMLQTLFQEGLEKWSMTISLTQINRVLALKTAFAGNVKSADRVWVKSLGHATRRWFVSGSMIHSWLDAAGDSTDPWQPVALTDTFLQSLASLAAAYGDVTVTHHAGENVLIARSGDEYVCADYPAGNHEDEEIKTFFEVRDDNEGRCTAVLKADMLHRVAESYFNSFSDITLDQENSMPAFTSFQIGDMWVQHTSDWSRWGASPVSGTMRAETLGETSLVIHGFYLWRAIRATPRGGEITLIVDGAEPEWMYVTGDDWGICVPAVYEPFVRFFGPLVNSFTECGFQLSDEDISHSNHQISFSSDDITISAQILDAIEGPDIVRLSAPIARSTSLTEATMLEVLSLNAELINAKLVLQEGNIYAVVDVPLLRVKESVADGVVFLRAAVARCSGLDEFLGLLGTAS